MTTLGRAGARKPLFTASIAAATFSFFLVCTVLAQSGSVYVDSQRRFTIRVPHGWVAKPFNASGVSGVTIAHGENAYVQIFLQKGIDPASFLKALNTGIETSHPGYKIADQGQRTVAGQSRMYIVGEAAETPTAPRTRVYLETFAANGFSYAIIASTSGKNGVGKDLMADFNVSQEMISSFTTNGEPAQATKTPAPAAPVKAPLPAVAHSPAPAPVVPPPPAPPPAAPPPVAAGPAANASPAAELAPEDQQKLAALDAALKGGVLTEEEYQAKKNALYSSAHPQQDDAAVLKALDQALKDGVLNKDEYDRKRKDLGLGGPPPAPSRNPVAGSEPPELKPEEVIKVKAEPQPEPLPKSWTTDTDPAGFAVNVPAAWKIVKMRATGQIAVHGTRGEEMLIWPLRLKQPELDARGAAALLRELARKFDVLMPWGSVQGMRNAARVTGQGSQNNATAVLSWANNAGGASVYFYGVEAPGSVYNDSTDSFAAILKSFQVLPDPSLKDVPAGANGSERAGMNFTTWSDPHEGAFRVSVPQGWHVIGGTYRLSVEDVRYGVVMDSPDGQVRASIGDAAVGAFTQSTQALAASGLREGAYQTLPDGTRVEILRYLSGQQFSRSYVETLVSRQCNNPQISSNNAREDLAALFSQSAANQGFIDALLTAGDVSFTCNLEGRPVKGKYVAATIRMSPNVSPMWFVYRLFGYIAFAGREQEGENALQQLIQSWKLTPEWEALQKNAANPAMATDSVRAQEIRERAEADIVDDQRKISELSAAGAAQRQKIYEQLDRKRQSSVLGTLDIVDSETGTQYRLSDFNDYHFLSNDGRISSVNSPGASGNNVREMIALQ
jgi:Short C-terminal domain